MWSETKGNLEAILSFWISNHEDAGKSANGSQNAANVLGMRTVHKEETWSSPVLLLMTFDREKVHRAAAFSSGGESIATDRDTGELPAPDTFGSAGYRLLCRQ